MNKYIPANRIEFAVTYLCNSRCRHCQLGETEQRNRFPKHVDKELAVEIVRKVGRKYQPESVMTFGGEPLLYPEIVYAIHREAKKWEFLSETSSRTDSGPGKQRKYRELPETLWNQV